jgi:hypothetical protein
MSRLRRVLAPLTALWLLCQVGTLALVPSMLQGSAAAAHATECTCGHGDGSMCPMHHHQPGGPVQCSMQPVHHSGTAVLTAVAAIVGFIAQPAGSIEPPRSVAHWHATDARAIGQRPVPPDPPPPRA